MDIELKNKIDQKYVLDSKTYSEFMKIAKHHLRKDEKYKETICNVYFDRETKPIGDEIRLRSYKVPSKRDRVYLEIKREYDGTSTKRCVSLKLQDFYNYLLTGEYPDVNDSSIMKEIDYAIRHYNLKPILFIGYDRLSYHDKDNSGFKITFDKRIRSRKKDLHLEDGDNGKLYFDEPNYVMELKTFGYIPLWFTSILPKLNLYPKSFSKYKTIYQKEIEEE